MEQNYIIAILAAALMATVFLNGCARENTPKKLPASGANNTLANPIVTKVGSATIMQAGGATSNVHVTPEAISFSARTMLPNGTYLRTQLFRDEKSEPWWPADRLVQVKDGMWQISVRLGENGAPSALSNEEGYRLEVWEKDNPSHKVDSLYFDLIPPPSPSR